MNKYYLFKNLPNFLKVLYLIILTIFHRIFGFVMELIQYGYETLVFYSIGSTLTIFRVYSPFKDNAMILPQYLILPQIIHDPIMFSEPESMNGYESQLFISPHVSSQKTTNRRLPGIPPHEHSKNMNTFFIFQNVSKSK